MRWIYASTTEELEERNSICEKIDAWWATFTQKTSDIDALFRQDSQWDLVGWMDENLHVISPKIMWEFGPAVFEGGHRLVITPESRYELRPLVDEIMVRAPQLDGWEFYEHRLSETSEEAIDMVEARMGLQLTNGHVALSVGRANRIDLVFNFTPHPDSEEAAFHAAVIASETLLGEEALDMWVGTITVADDIPDDGPRFVPMDRVKERFDAMTGSLVEQLPDSPHASQIDEETQYTVFSCEPVEADDYAGHQDLISFMTMNPDVVAAALDSAPFASERFSRCDETFCYLKIDGDDEDAPFEFEEREEIELAIHMVINELGPNAVIGAGTGIRYSYIDLALVDVEGCIAAIRKRLQAAKAPRRSWLLFHDTSMRGEWVGIYEDSPPPPLPDFDEEYEL